LPVGTGLVVGFVMTAEGVGVTVKSALVVGVGVLGIFVGVVVAIDLTIVGVAVG